MVDYRPIALAEDRPLWEQQPDESPRMYHYFLLYRDAGRVRTLAKVGETLTKTAEYMRQLSRRYRWVERAEAWDKHHDEQWTIEVEHQRREMARNHVQLANDMLQKVADKLSVMQLKELKAADISRWVEIAVKVKRAAYGEPESTVAVTGPDGGPVMLDMTKMSIEQRRQRLAELRAELDRRVPQHAG